MKTRGIFRVSISMVAATLALNGCGRNEAETAYEATTARLRAAFDGTKTPEELIAEWGASAACRAGGTLVDPTSGNDAELSGFIPPASCRIGNLDESGGTRDGNPLATPAPDYDPNVRPTCTVSQPTLGRGEGRTVAFRITFGSLVNPIVLAPSAVDAGGVAGAYTLGVRGDEAVIYFRLLDTLPTRDAFTVTAGVTAALGEPVLCSVAVPAEEPPVSPTPDESPSPENSPIPDESPTPDGSPAPSVSPSVPVPSVSPSIPATATAVPVPPTATVTAVPPTATFTAVPPTATFTTVPSATFTTVPSATFTTVPSATFTTVPPATFTSIPSATFTSVPTNTFTERPAPTQTFTPRPTNTFTDRPLPTRTMTSAPTNTFTFVPSPTRTPWVPTPTWTPRATVKPTSPPCHRTPTPRPTMAPTRTPTPRATMCPTRVPTPRPSTCPPRAPKRTPTARPTRTPCPERRDRWH